MYSRGVRSSLTDPEIGFRRNPVTENDCTAGVLRGNLHHHLVTERREGIVIKDAARNRVANLKAGMVDHDAISILR
jgi:hypothetical protein